jgi:hypothetical protein
LLSFQIFFNSRELHEDTNWIESHSFDAFKRIWKLNKLDHVWMLRNEKEDFNDFFSELSIYVVDVMLEEYSKPAINRSLTIYCACAYALLILYSTQPARSEHILVKEEENIMLGASGKLMSYIELPEYSHNAFLTMEETLREMEAHNALIKLCKEQAFLICVERSVVYSTHSKIPFQPRNVAGTFMRGTATAELLSDENRVAFSKEKLDKLEKLYLASDENQNFLEKMKRLCERQSIRKKKIEALSIIKMKDEKSRLVNRFHRMKNKTMVAFHTACDEYQRILEGENKQFIKKEEVWEGILEDLEVRGIF